MMARMVAEIAAAELDAVHERIVGRFARSHAAGSSAQAVITARPRRWPLVLIMKPSQAGVESACT